MSRANMFIKVEIEHEEEDNLERLAGEICRQVMKVYGVRSAELSSVTAPDE